MLMSFIKKIHRNRWMLRALLPSLVFNFKHLPFSQARKLPILLYKADLRNTKGKIIISTPVRFGMIRLGVESVSIFPNNGVMIENRGKIIFHGNTMIGNNSAISLGEKGVVEFGDNFMATTGLKLVCYDSVSFDRNVLIGWNVQIVDTDFHMLKNVNGGGKKGYGPIRVGSDVWIANGCKIYKNVTIPSLCVVGADTILHKGIKCPPYSLITCKMETEVCTQGFYLDRNDNEIQYAE